MELHFSDRDRVGVQDSVLLEDYENIDVFIDNLRKRHRADLIYVSKKTIKIYKTHDLSDVSKQLSVNEDIFFDNT